MNILFNVDCPDQEESNWLAEINEEELTLLNPLLIAIKSNGGYFPTGTFKLPGEPTVEELYGNIPGFSIINRFLPTPLHGFSKIKTVYLFETDPKILELS